LNRNKLVRGGHLMLVMLLVCAGCVRRTLTITTEPPQAIVYLNDQELGRSAVTTDFLWYGDYRVVVRKEGYKTLHSHWDIKPPWYQVIPFDFFFEVLWPGKLHDQHARHFVLEPEEPVSTDELVERALRARDRALDPRK
jgi:hypothetical protein